MNVVAMSLYGREEKYLRGAVENAKSMERFYPGWMLHVWLGSDVPKETRAELAATGAFLHSAPEDCQNGMFWRFLAHDLAEVDRFVCRDADSRFSARETKAVEDWCTSGEQLHIMRDHPFHNQFIMGGMWGWKRKKNDSSIKAPIFAWVPRRMQQRWGNDIEFLTAWIKQLQPSTCVHDSCGTFDGTRNWPPEDPGFVGEYFDADNNPNLEHRRIRWKHFLSSHTSDSETPLFPMAS